jgi:hypothetical protein
MNTYLTCTLSTIKIVNFIKFIEKNIQTHFKVELTSDYHNYLLIYDLDACQLDEIKKFEKKLIGKTRRKK